MKIALFHNLPPGGALKVANEQIRFLSQSHQVDLYRINDPQEPQKYNFSLHNKFPGILHRLYSDYKNFILLSILHQKIALDIDKKNYDIVIVHPDKYTQSPFLLRYLKTNNIYYCHEWLRIVYEKEYFFNENVTTFKKWYENMTRKIRKAIDRSNAVSARKIIANSKFTAANIKKSYQKKADVVYPGVDINIFKPMNDAKKIYDLLFIGEKTQQEGFPLLKLVEQISKKPLSLKIISKSGENFLMGEKELGQMYNKARIVICLAGNEPFGMIPLEAMSCGVPVIALNSGGYKETILNARTGFLVEPDAKSLSEKINYLLENEKERNKMAHNAREHIEKNWSWEICLNALNICIKKS